MMNFGPRPKSLTPNYGQSALRALVGVSALMLTMLGCRQDPVHTDPPARSAATRPLDCVPIDCAEVRGDDLCERHEADLSFWCAEVPPEAALSVHAEPADAPVERLEDVRVAGGRRLRVKLSLNAQALRISAGRTFKEIHVRTRPPDPRVRRAMQLRKAGRFEEARATLQGAEADPSPVVQVHVRSWLARIDLSEGRIERSIDGLEGAIVDAEAQGLRTTAAFNRLALADTLRRHQGALRRAREVLDAMAHLPPRHAAETEHQLGLIAELSGNVRAASTHFAKARKLAQQFGQPTLVSAVEHSLSRLDATLGLATTPPQAGMAKEPCHTAQKQSDRAWLSILRAAAGHEAIEGLTPFQEAVAPFRTTCPSRWSLKNALINLAIAAEMRGNMQVVEEAVAEAKQIPLKAPVLESWIVDLEGRLVAHRGQHRVAAQIYQKAVHEIAPSASFETRYRLHLGLARALRSTRRRDEAEQHYRQAMNALAREEQLAPIFAGQETLVLSRGEAEQELVDLLLAAHRYEAALTEIRRGRTRHLRAIGARQHLSRLPQSERARFEERLGEVHRRRAALSQHHQNAWAIPLAERGRHDETSRELTRALEEALDEAFFAISEHASEEVGPSPQEAEALYTVYATSRGTYAFMQTHDATSVATIRPRGSEDEDAWLRDALSRPFAKALSTMSTLRVLDNASMAGANVHAAPFRVDETEVEQPLIEHVAVVYALDVPARAPLGTAAVHTTPPRMLIAGNPTDDLAMAAREATRVRGAASEVFDVVERRGGEVTADRLRQDLAAAHWFHYAGHAVHDSAHQLGSALTLSGGSEFTVADILSLPRAPTSVVLSSCEGARVTAHGSVAGLGIAQAFIIAGSEAVIASNRPVSDTVALSLSEALYLEPAVSLTPENVRTRLRALRSKAPVEWLAFRLITR